MAFLLEGYCIRFNDTRKQTISFFHCSVIIFNAKNKELIADLYSRQEAILLNIYSSEGPLRYCSIPYSGENPNF